MADTSAATENMVTPESNKPRTSNEPASPEPHTTSEMVGGEAQTSNETLPAELQTTEELAPMDLQSQNEDRRGTTNDVEQFFEEILVKPEPKDEEMQEVEIKKELEEDTTTFINHANRNQQTEEKSLVGKLKIKPMASLVQTNPPNPQPGLHPFFAGFDDHIRSLIMNRQPPFPMNSPLMQRPVQFMYYDNSTNMNLKKMLNGHKMAAPVSVSRHPTFRPYVPINVPRPPRSQVRFRTSFSTQTPPMFMGGQPDVPATPSTSYQWLPQSRPPVRNLTPQNNSPAQNRTSPKNFFVPSFTPPNKSTTSKFIPPNNLVTPDFVTSNKSTAPNFPLLCNSSVPNVAAPPTNRVSTSSSTDDLEKHSSENSVKIKTEVDLGIDCKDDLQATLNDSNSLGTHFMDTEDSTMQTPDKVTSNLETTDPNPGNLILTGDAVTPPPPKEVPKRSTAYELPAYSTKGWLLCKYCDFRCNRRKKLREHSETMHTSENHFKCFYCIKKLLPNPYHKTVHDLEHHVAKVHRGEKRWQCKYCSKTYKCQASYKAHMEKTCSQSHPYACHMCTFTCITEAALEKHIKSHEKIQETQQCPFCNKTFKRFYMKQHLITVHAPPEEKPFHCISCDFATGTQSVIDNHYKRSGHDKQFKCDHCDYASRSEGLVKVHVELVHNENNANKLICGVEGCQVKCVNARSLKVHRRMHAMPESELVVCPDKECLKKFATGQSLRYHVNKTQHHKPFKCSDCTLRFLKEESLCKHIQSVHVNSILKKMEKPDLEEPVCVKNVVDVYNYVESSGERGTRSIENLQSEIYGEVDSVSNFGCWLGISGFGDITNKTDCDNEVPSEANISEGRSEEVCQVKKMEEEEEEDDDEDEDIQNLVPITCLVEQDETADISNSSGGKTDNGDVLLKKEEDENMDDSEYQHVNPELSCLVECQQNATVDSSPENETELQDGAPTNLLKIEVEEGILPKSTSI